MANTYLYRTPGSAGNRGIWTVSCWVKKSNPTKRTVLFGTPGSDNNSTSNLIFHQDSGVRWGVNSFNVFTTSSTFLMRDPASWYHLVLSINTSEGSSDNRTKFYINGERFTNFDGNNLNSVSNGFQYGWNNTILHTICKDPAPSGTDYFSGYITNFVNIDGQALAPSSFGETDSTTGEWKPKADLSGLTFGTNGCWLKFENEGNLGADSSGNGNNWTVSGAGTNAKTTDTANNSFATFNSIAPTYASGSTSLVLSEGNLKTVMSNGGNGMRRSSLAAANGKWYAEFKVTSTAAANSDDFGIGVVPADNYQIGRVAGDHTGGVVYLHTGQKRTDASGYQSYGNSYTTGDIISVALDMDNGQVFFYKNGTIQDSGTAAATGLSGAYVMMTQVNDATSGSHTVEVNFGNPTFTIASGNADANGFGNFEYAVPSGYYALCTKNINSYG